MSQDLDEALVERVRAGDRSAFRAIFEAYHERLYRLALGHMRNHHDAEDALQDAFLSAHRALPSFRGDARLSTWLYRITVNSCVDLKRKPRPPSASLDDRDAPPLRLVSDDPASDPERQAEARAIRADIDRALARLTPLERSVFVLRHYSDLPVKEVAAVLDRAEGTVKNMLFRAMRKLRTALRDHRPAALHPAPATAPAQERLG